MRKRISMGLGAVALLAASASHSSPEDVKTMGECGAPPETWLVGTWGTPKSFIRIWQDGQKLVWEFTREAGVMTARWGEKKPAKATGEVTKLTGCAVEMKGRYTEYGGTPKAIGWPMEYRVTYDGTGTLAGKGLGFGREWYEVRWPRQN